MAGRYQAPSLSDDAGNRALRSVLQAIALEIGVVVIPELYRALGDDTWSPTWDWAEGLARIAGLALLAFVMRRYLDPSKVPTPLPPAPVPPPAN